MVKISKIMACLSVVFFVSACVNSGVIHTVEVTRLVPTTVEVTRIIQQTAIVTRVVQPTSLPQLSTDTPQVSVVEEKEYYAGTIIITQYYTFLDHGLYEEAFELLSSSAQRPHSLDEYLRMAKLSFKAVEIVTILPFFMDVEDAGGHANPDPEGKIRFVVRIKAWGEGNMSGSILNGTLQTIFIGLIYENGQWRIDSFATAPSP